MRVSAPSGPVRCSWPMTSASVCGRRRSASGRLLSNAGSSLTRRQVSHILYLPRSADDLPDYGTVALDFEAPQRRILDISLAQFGDCLISTPLTPRMMSRGGKADARGRRIAGHLSTATPSVSARHLQASRQLLGASLRTSAPDRGFLPPIITVVRGVGAGLFERNRHASFPLPAEHTEFHGLANSGRRQAVTERIGMLDRVLIDSQNHVADEKPALRRGAALRDIGHQCADQVASCRDASATSGVTAWKVAPI